MGPDSALAAEELSDADVETDAHSESLCVESLRQSSSSVSSGS